MTSDYQIWITANGEEDKLQLPVNPETLNVSNGSRNDSIDIVGLGEIIIKQGRPAFQFSWSSFFPSDAFPGVKVKEVKKPVKLIKKLEEWKESDKPVHLLVTKCKIDVYCMIEKFDYSESGGDVGSYDYTIVLKEYREITVRRVTIDIPTQKASIQPTEQRVDNTTPAQTYTVVPGDFLYKIARTQLQNESRWREIYDLNKGVIGSNPNLIYPGQVFTLPAV